MDFPALLSTFLAAMTPLGELRLSIPLGIWTLGLPWYQALSVSVAGNVLPVLFLVPGLEQAARLLRRSFTPAARLLDWRAEKLRRVYTGRFERYGPIALVALVAIPLPLTGAWTGSLAAWVFQVPPRTAIPLIVVGIVVAGVAVTLLVEAGIHVSLLLSK